MTGAGGPVYTKGTLGRGEGDLDAASRFLHWAGCREGLEDDK